MNTSIAALQQKRSVAADRFTALANQDVLSAEEAKEFDTIELQIKDYDDAIARQRKAQAVSAATAQPVADQDGPAAARTPAQAKIWSRYETEKSLVVAGCIKSFINGGGTLWGGRQASIELYGENHPVTKALGMSTGTGGGFMVPPDYMNEIIELLRPESVVRSSGPRNIPMPRGTMTLPGQASAATANYGSETGQIVQSQQSLKAIVASYKKLTALVPVSNDMMRYADPAVDAFIRDDLVEVIGLREDLAFILGDGTADGPMGWLGFANRWVGANGGTIGAWSTSANSTLAVNGADPANSTGGNFITSNATFVLATVAAELGGAVNRLDQANVKDRKRIWFFNPRIKNYLYNVQNSLGVYVFRDEMNKGTLLGYPFKISTQIPTNYWDAAGSNKDLSLVFLVEMTESIILDSMTLELAVSNQGTYIDAGGNTVNAFQQDQTLIRAIEEHDFQMRHDQSVAVIQGVRWAPAIS